MIWIRLFPVLLFVPGMLSAADAFIGKWTLNVDKSDFGNALEPKSSSTKYRLRFGGYLCESESDYGDGYKSRLAIPVRFDGKPEPGFLDGRKVIFSSEKISTKSYKVSVAEKQTGKVSQIFQYVVSDDGTTLTFSWFKSGPDKPSQILVYDKQ